MIEKSLKLFTDLMAMPTVQPEALRVCRRNLVFFRYDLGFSLIAILAEPVVTFLALGYGLGHFLGSFGGHPYVQFLAAGMAAITTMMVSFTDIAYAVLGRLQKHNSYLATLQAPLTASDIAMGEIIWSALKGAGAGVVIILVSAALGLVNSWQATLSPFVLTLVGVIAAACGLWAGASARSYNTLTLLQALIFIPMSLLADTFFPFSSMSATAGAFTSFLPLAHATQAVRALCSGEVGARLFLNLAVLILLSVVTVNLSALKFERSLIPD